MFTDEKQYELLFSAIEEENLQKLRATLEENIDMKQLHQHFSISPLRSGIQTRNPEVCALLLKHGAFFNQAEMEDCFDDTIKSQNRDLLKVFIQHGVNINPEFCKYDPPLYQAVERQNLEITSLLLENNADPNILSSNNRTPLFLAKTKELAELLLEYGASPNELDNHYFTPLHLAYNNEDVAKLLLEYGADINGQNILGRTPLDMVRLFSYTRKVKDLFYLHIFKLQALGLYVCRKNKDQLSEEIVSKYKDQIEDFKAEIQKMKNTMIDDGYRISFYHLLTDSEEKIVKYLKNVSIRSELLTESYKTKFPSFSSMVRHRVRVGIQKLNLVNDCYIKMNDILYGKIVPEVVLKIVNYFEDEDLKFLVNSFNNVTLH